MGFIRYPSLRLTNYLPADAGLINVRGIKRKFFIEERTIYYENVNEIIFKEIEPNRIFKNILSLRKFNNNFRTYTGNFTNMYASKRLERMLSKGIAKYSPKLPHKKRKANLSKVFVSFFNFFDIEGYVFSASRGSLRNFRQLAGQRNIFLKTSLDFFPSRRAYP